MSSPAPSRPMRAGLPSPASSAQIRHARSTAIVSREVADETIVVPICRGVGDLDSVYTFNPLGRMLWSLLEKGQTAEELANWISGRYQVCTEQALTDVQSYLAELEQIGLIRRV
ncbi:MAG TPA: PqqD family protein [Candidatus Acidoferrum sp.]|nr:PqqD family protein [Candidatus Acidoferrum sp.]